MVGAILLSELFEELTEWQVNSFCTICEVGKTIISLTFSIDDLVTSLLDKVCFILPQMVSLLQCAIASEDARSIKFDVIIKKALGSHGFVITLRHLVIIRRLQLNTLLSKEIMEIMMAKLASNPHRKWSFGMSTFLVEPNAQNQRKKDQKVYFEPNFHRLRDLNTVWPRLL